MKIFLTWLATEWIKLAVDMPPDMLGGPDMSPGRQAGPKTWPEIDFDRWLVPNTEFEPPIPSAILVLLAGGKPKVSLRCFVNEIDYNLYTNIN